VAGSPPAREVKSTSIVSVKSDRASVRSFASTAASRASATRTSSVWSTSVFAVIVSPASLGSASAPAVVIVARTAAAAMVIFLLVRMSVPLG